MEKIGITGSRGFIGSHLTKALKLRGGVSLSFFDLPEGDLFKPGKKLGKFVGGKDVIIHAAAVNRGTDTEVVAGSVVATYNLISAMKAKKSRAKLIYLSSIQAETGALYGQSKKLAEVMLEDFSRENKSSVSVFRLTNVFGERGRPFYNSVVPTFCFQVVNNRKLIVKNGDKKIRFIYVEDVAKIILAEVFKKRKRAFFLKRISSNNEISISNLAKLIMSFKNLDNPGKLKSKFHKNLYKTYLSYSK
ncbi:MAG: NAD-dependent epimerase/dehydratase family protein [Candidatus Paceibacterota bacterium]